MTNSGTNSGTSQGTSSGKSQTNPGKPQRKSLRYRNAFGVPDTTELTIVGDLALPGAVLPARIVMDRSGRRMVQKWVPRQLGESHPAYFDLLDSEIRAGAKLAQTFAGTRYPVELSRLIGYDVDCREPFVLLDEYRGEPAAQHAHRLGRDERYRFQVGLLRALLHTGAAGVVHGGVSLATLRWDRSNLQLVDFEQACRVGELRRRNGTLATGSAPQSGSAPQPGDYGLADPRDDVWAAGAIIHELATGRRANGGRYDLSQDSEALQFLLHGVFAEQPTARPSAADLLQRLRADDSLKAAPDHDAVLAAGRQAFEEASARKRGWAAEPAPPPPAPQGSSGKTILTVLVVLIIVVISTAVILGAMQ